MWLLSLLIVIYAFSILALIYGFTQITPIETTPIEPKTKFTILVPFRNEADNLPKLLDSFSKLKYPTDSFEVLLIDDASAEKLSVFSYPFSVKIINNCRKSNSPKKDAIATAMQRVKTDWVITTDADCSVNEGWLLAFDTYIQTHDVSMICGAVTYDINSSFLDSFQQLDLASLQGATIGSFGLQKGFMCNGANFAYTKAFFEELKGFEGNDTIASGDDVFLLQKAIAKNPEVVHYLKSKNTIVTTKPTANWKALFHQRVRWASKTSSYQSVFGKVLGLLVLFGNLSWIVSLGSWTFGFLSNIHFFLLYVLKFTVDTVLIVQTLRFLTKEKIRYVLLSSLWYPFFSVAVAFYSLFGKYEWKGRRF